VIRAFPEFRWGDLWAGIGLAASYTGAQSPGAVERLADAADGFRCQLGQGAAFAAKARVLAGPVPRACAETIELLTGTDAASAADWTDACLAGASARGGDDVPTYERWRAGIMKAVAHKNGGGATD
jgi:hypothetical protein